MNIKELFDVSAFGDHAPFPSTGAVYPTLAGAVLVALLALAPATLAQLPVGGLLGPDPAEQEIEDQIEDDLGDSFEESVEDEVADAVEDDFEDQIDETVEQFTEQNIQENIEDNIEEAIEQTVDASIEDKVEDAITDVVDVAVGDALEDQVEQQVADTVEAAVDEAIQDSSEAAIETQVDEDLTAAIEDTIEESIEGGVADALEGTVEDGILANVEASVEASVADDVQESVEAQILASVEGDVEAAVEDTVADAVEAGIEAGVEDSIESSVDSRLEDVLEGEVEERTALAIEERLENEIDQILDGLESDLEADENRIQKEQWLVMAEPAVFTELTDRGYLFDTITDLPGLGLRLAEVAAPSTFDITAIRDGVLDVVGKDRAEVDLNHIYTAGVPETVAGEGLSPRAAMPFPADLDDLDVRIGMIDSFVDTTHPSLVNSHIEQRSFAKPGAETPNFHGTAIASIIAGSSPEYQGLAPRAEVFAASVFELSDGRGEIASTVSLVRALDWLISSEVSVINISLAGPPNRLLEKALERAAARNMVVMAAAGNGGPVARPMYPAAYSSVVAVTAVDSARRVFRLANRGDYLALAAPGVDLRHAQSGGGFAASSGTSFAVPFAVTAAARLSRLHPETDIVTALLQSALDLGPPGRDSIYGYGLLTLGSL